MKRGVGRVKSVCAACGDGAFPAGKRQRARRFCYNVPEKSDGALLGTDAHAFPAYGSSGGDRTPAP